MKDKNNLGQLEEATSKELVKLHLRLNKIIDSQRKQSAPSTIRIKDKTFWIHPGVFNPKKGHLSLSLLPYLNFKKNSTVLDMGCGLGLYAIFSAYEGAKKVVGIDVNPLAVSCAIRNVKMHNLNRIVDIRQGDLFSPLKPDEKFNVILCNPPFFRSYKSLQSMDYIQRCFLDERGRFLKGFLEGAGNHLERNGRILMLYGKTGAVNKLLQLVKAYKYKSKILEIKNSPPDKFYILELISL